MNETLKRLAVILFLALLVLGTGFIRSAYSHPPEVRNVTPTEVGDATHLNITIWHDISNSLHYVDTIEVTYGDNITSITINPQPLEPDGTFSINYNLGLISGTPTITVRARCTITGYTDTVPWIGQIPEFQSLILLALLMISTLFAVLIYRSKHV